MTKTFVVAGNGPSLAQILPDRISADDTIMRTNSFFLEPQYFLGKRVDLALIAGDPRVAPFVFATLKKCLDHYQLGAWSAVRPKVIAAGHRFLPGLHQQMIHKDAQVTAKLDTLSAKYQATPTSGVQAVVLAHGMGAESVILAGLDMYSGHKRYAYEPGRNMTDLLGKDLDQRRYDTRLHNPDLDAELLDYLATRADLRIQLAAPNKALPNFDVAPVRHVTPFAETTKPRAEDWVSWAGFYPIGALKILRKLSSAQRKVAQIAKRDTR